MSGRRSIETKPLEFYSTSLPGVDCAELQGKLIVIEGPDAVGRSTQVVRLRRWLEQNGHALFYLPAANYTEGNLDAVREMLGHPETVMALADGGAHYGLICDASFPTFYLQRWARDAAEAERIPLPQAIAELTAKPAALIGMTDRGRIAVGMKADLNVIDLAALRLPVPTIVYDLPAGGKRMQQGAEGISATIVSGVVTYRDGQHTGALPGRLVRRTSELLAA